MHRGSLSAKQYEKLGSLVGRACPTADCPLLRPSADTQRSTEQRTATCSSQHLVGPTLALSVNCMAYVAGACMSVACGSRSALAHAQGPPDTARHVIDTRFEPSFHELCVGNGIEGLVSNTVRPIRTVHFDHPADRLAERPTRSQSLSKQTLDSE